MIFVLNGEREREREKERARELFLVSLLGKISNASLVVFFTTQNLWNLRCLFVFINFVQ